MECYAITVCFHSNYLNQGDYQSLLKVKCRPKEFAIFSIYYNSKDYTKACLNNPVIAFKMLEFRVTLSFLCGILQVIL